MRVTPKTQEQIAAEEKARLDKLNVILKPGIYDFEITNAVEGKSKSSGADMITLTLRVFDESGDEVTVMDYLVDAMAYKLRHLCESLGLLSDYEYGVLDAVTLLNRCGKCEIVIKKNTKLKNDGTPFPDQNQVKDYIVPDAPVAQKPVTQKPNESDPWGDDMSDVF